MSKDGGMAQSAGTGTFEQQAQPAPDFQAILGTVPRSYLVLTPELEIVAVSDAFPGTGAGPAQLIGKNVFDAFSEHAEPDAMVALRASLERVRRLKVADAMAVQQHPVTLPAADGGGSEIRYWSAINVPVLGLDDRLAYIVHRVEDVTDYLRLTEREVKQQKLAEDLRQRIQQLEAEVSARSLERGEASLGSRNGSAPGSDNASAPRSANASAPRSANDAKSEFIDRASHELRRPLNAILGFGELLSVDNISAEHREWVSMMLKAGRQLLQLLDELVDITRGDGQALSLSMQAVPVRSLISDAIELVRPLSMSRGVQLEPAPQLATSYYVHGDDQRLRQVLLNLLSNAIKFNHPAGKVSVTVNQQAGDRLRISVIDTGRGVASRDLDRLFVPFERLDAANAGIEGTGLGLALSRQLIEAMGGTTGVTSRHGEGSVFWLELPATEPVAVSQQAIERDTVVLSRAYTSTKTVLYVEDMVENLRLVEQILKQRPSTTVVPAMLAGVALDLARQYQPDLILLDLGLPDMPGEEVLQLLRADPGTADIPVVILSAEVGQHRIDRLLANGATAYLTKPISVRSLLQVIDRVLGEPMPPAAAPTIADGTIPAQRTPHGDAAS
jgi:signal transduction histidine kinase/ActR/RegA family two-component response regulator